LSFRYLKFYNNIVIDIKMKYGLILALVSIGALTNTSVKAVHLVSRDEDDTENV